MGQNYGYETLMTELPTFMKQILHFDIKSVSCLYAAILIYMVHHVYLSCCCVQWTCQDELNGILVSERHYFLTALSSHVDLLYGNLPRRRLDDLDRQVQSHVHEENHKQHRPVRTGDRINRRLVHWLQFLADGDDLDHRRGFERWHLFGIQG